jgi:phage gp37-like protein
MYTVTEIEDAIVDRLKSEVGYLRTCASLGQFLVNESREFTRLFPAAYVSYARGSYDHRMNGIQDREMVFDVVCMASNARGDEAARHGDGTGKGAYDVMEDVRAALTNQSCGLNIDPLLPESEEHIEGDQKMAIYAVTFRTRCRFVL